MKAIKIIFTLALISSALSFNSCKDSKEDFLTASKLYLVHSGVQALHMYDKGESTVYTYQLDLYKSGALKNGASAKIGIMSQQELDAYNEANGTSYSMLDPGSYQIENLDVVFSDDVKDVNRTVNVRFYPAKIVQSVKNEVLPIKIVDSSLEINAEKAVCLINPQVLSPRFNIEIPQSRVVNYTKGEQTILDFNISVVLDIDTNATDINVEMELDQDYIDRYNQENGEDYQIPESDKFSFVKTATLKAGQKQILFNVKIFQQYLEKNYMLPIRLKLSSAYTVNREQYYVIQLNALSQLLSRANWTIAGFSSEEARGENNGANGRAIHAIDGNNSTFWHSQWQGTKAQPPHWLIIDMGRIQTVTSIALRPRGSGDQSPTKAGEFYVCDSYDSNAPENAEWRKIGAFEMNLTANEQLFNVKKSPGRYLRILMTDIRSGDKTTSLAEVNAYGY